VGSAVTGLSGAGSRLGPWECSVDEVPTCSECWARYLCGGGCKQENLSRTGDLTLPSAETCSQQERFIDGILSLVAAQGNEYRARDRSALKHLFVSCGRPVVRNDRSALPDEAVASLRHIRPVV
jgi:hypothetical protein